MWFGKIAGYFPAKCNHFSHIFPQFYRELNFFEFHSLAASRVALHIRLVSERERERERERDGGGMQRRERRGSKRPFCFGVVVCVVYFLLLYKVFQ